MQAVDIALFQDKVTGIFDIAFEGGDFVTVNNFDTSLQVSLFSDARANASQVPRVELRRGWWGNQFSADFPDFAIGSLLWLLRQSRKTTDTLNSAIDFAQNALQWLVTDNHAQNVTVTGAITDTGITLAITIFRGSSITETKYYDLWNNTGQI